MRDARLENRDWSTLAASLVTGLEVKSVATNSPAIDWDTTKEANGWKVFTDGEDKREVVVQNDVPAFGTACYKYKIPLQLSVQIYIHPDPFLS
jgi:hypothetical protein